MILIINNYSKNLSNIKKILKNLKEKYIVKKQRALLKHFNKKKIKGIILSGGGPFLDESIHFSQIRANISCMINYDCPILGICQGHEIISEACGSEVVKLKKPARFRNLKVKIIKKNEIFKDFPNFIEVYEYHSRYVKNVSDELLIAASSKKDKIEAIFHKTKPFYGVQFHPERSGYYGKKIIENFLYICNTYKRKHY